MQFLVPIFIVGFVMGLLGWIAYVILEDRAHPAPDPRHERVAGKAD